MYLEKLTIRNFQSFGPVPTTMTFSRRLTAFLGANAAGKTAACQALLRIFSVVAEQRQIRAEDFHVPHDETTVPASRTLTIEAVFAFPELNSGSAGDAGAAQSVPEFFAQMTADDDGVLKLRIVLEASWVDDGSVNGTVERAGAWCTPLRRTTATSGSSSAAPTAIESRWSTYPPRETAFAR